MVSIVNYGMGNIKSIQNALDYLGVRNSVVTRPEQIKASDKIILPGVGSFAAAMKSIRTMELVEPLAEAVLIGKRPVLGICLGMQLLADSGDEDGPTEGLGYISGRVTRLPASHGLKLPHIGFNVADFNKDNRRLFEGLGTSADFYFIHNFKFDCTDPRNVAAWTTYGETFASSVSREHIFGTQFHPEKSQSNGLVVLRNFCKLAL